VPSGKEVTDFVRVRIRTNLNVNQENDHRLRHGLPPIETNPVTLRKWFNDAMTSAPDVRLCPDDMISVDGRFLHSIFDTASKSSAATRALFLSVDVLVPVAFFPSLRDCGENFFDVHNAVADWQKRSRLPVYVLAYVFARFVHVTHRVLGGSSWRTAADGRWQLVDGIVRSYINDNSCRANEVPEREPSRGEKPPDEMSFQCFLRHKGSSKAFFDDAGYTSMSEVVLYNGCSIARQEELVRASRRNGEPRFRIERLNNVAYVRANHRHTMPSSSGARINTRLQHPQPRTGQSKTHSDPWMRYAHFGESCPSGGSIPSSSGGAAGSSEPMPGASADRTEDRKDNDAVEREAAALRPPSVVNQEAYDAVLETLLMDEGRMFGISPSMVCGRCLYECVACGKFLREAALVNHVDSEDHALRVVALRRSLDQSTRFELVGQSRSKDEDGFLDALLGLIVSHVVLSLSDVVKLSARPKAQVNKYLYQLARYGQVMRVRESPPLWVDLSTANDDIVSRVLGVYGVTAADEVHAHLQKVRPNVVSSQGSCNGAPCHSSSAAAQREEVTASSRSLAGSSTEKPPVCPTCGDHGDPDFESGRCAECRLLGIPLSYNAYVSAKEGERDDLTGSSTGKGKAQKEDAPTTSSQRLDDPAVGDGTIQSSVPNDIPASLALPVRSYAYQAVSEKFDWKSAANIIGHKQRWTLQYQTVCSSAPSDPVQFVSTLAVHTSAGWSSNDELKTYVGPPRTRKASAERAVARSALLSLRRNDLFTATHLERCFHDQLNKIGESSPELQASVEDARGPPLPTPKIPPGVNVRHSDTMSDLNKKFRDCFGDQSSSETFSVLTKETFFVKLYNDESLTTLSKDDHADFNFGTTCPLCGDFFRDSALLSVHQRTCHPDQIKCSCKQKFSDQMSLRRHARSKGCQINARYSEIEAIFRRLDAVRSLKVDTTDIEERALVGKFMIRYSLSFFVAESLREYLEVACAAASRRALSLSQKGHVVGARSVDGERALTQVQALNIEPVQKSSPISPSQCFRLSSAPIVAPTPTSSCQVGHVSASQKSDSPMQSSVVVEADSILGATTFSTSVSVIGPPGLDAPVRSFAGNRKEEQKQEDECLAFPLTSDDVRLYPSVLSGVNNVAIAGDDCNEAEKAQSGVKPLIAHFEKAERVSGSKTTSSLEPIPESSEVVPEAQCEVLPSKLYEIITADGATALTCHTENGDFTVRRDVVSSQPLHSVVRSWVGGTPLCKLVCNTVQFKGRTPTIATRGLTEVIAGGCLMLFVRYSELGPRVYTRGTDGRMPSEADRFNEVSLCWLSDPWRFGSRTLDCTIPNRVMRWINGVNLFPHEESDSARVSTYWNMLTAPYAVSLCCADYVAVTTSGVVDSPTVASEGGRTYCPECESWFRNVETFSEHLHTKKHQTNANGRVATLVSEGKVQVDDVANPVSEDKVQVDDAAREPAEDSCVVVESTILESSVLPLTEESVAAHSLPPNGSELTLREDGVESSTGASFFHVPSAQCDDAVSGVFSLGEPDLYVCKIKWFREEGRELNVRVRFRGTPTLTECMRAVRNFVGDYIPRRMYYIDEDCDQCLIVEDSFEDFLASAANDPDVPPLSRILRIFLE
jgi:hypothetical protein